MHNENTSSSVTSDAGSAVGYRGGDRLSLKGTLGHNTNNHILQNYRKANTVVFHRRRVIVNKLLDNIFN